MATPPVAFSAKDATMPGHYSPSETALMLLDFHTLFVQNVAGAKGPVAFEVAANMRKWAKSQGIQIIHCLIDVNGTPFPACKDHDTFAGVIQALKHNGGEEPADLYEGDSKDEPLFTRKPGHISVLKSPGLEEYLQKKGIKSLILTGLSTSQCVLKSAVAACDAEYVVTVLSDGCADGEQEVHDLVVGKILTNRSYVATAAEFQEGYTKIRSS